MYERAHIIRYLPPSSSGKPVSGMRPAHSCSARSRLAASGRPSASEGRQLISTKYFYIEELVQLPVPTSASEGRQSIMSAPPAAVPTQPRKQPQTDQIWMIV